MLPSNSDLTYFLEIARHGNVTRAADQLGITQPSLSLAMQRLESSVGTSLFIRSRHGVSLTKAGQQLVAEAKRLLDNWEQLRSKTLNTLNEVRGRFTIGCHPSVARYSLPLFLPKLLSNHPKLEISLVHDLSRQITQKVLDLEVDLAIVVNPNPHPDLVMKLLTKDVVTLFKNSDCKNNDVMICEPDLIQTQQLLAKLKRSGSSFTRTLESSNLEVILSLVEAGAGIGILPERVATSGSKGLTMVKGAPSFPDQIFMIYRSENKSVKAIAELSKIIQSSFR